jgi:hypothetical protein
MSLDVLLNQERVGLQRALAIFRDVMAGLAHAHAHQVIHRDPQSAAQPGLWRTLQVRSSSGKGEVRSEAGLLGV